MNIKSTTTLGLTLVLALGAAACGGDGDGSGSSDALSATGPITVWLSNNPEEIAWGEEMVAAWNAENPDEKITAQEIPAGKTSEEVIGAAITAGNAPCLVFNTSPAAVPQFQKQGGLVALDSFPDGQQYVEERTGAAAEQYQSPDGSYYQIPWKSNPVMIFYNKDLMKKAGVDPENPPLATYDEFLATSEKIVSSGAAEAAIWPAPTSEFFQSWFDFYPLYAAETGGTQLVEDAKATFNSPEGEAVAEFWKTMYDEGYSLKEKYNGDSFADGKAAMSIVGPWAIAVYGKDINWGVAPVPDLCRHGPRGDLHLLRRQERRHLLRLRCTGDGVGGPEVRHQRGAGRLAAGEDRPDAAEGGRRGGVPRLLRGQPRLPDVRRAGGPDRRGAQRGQQHRDLAELPRPVHGVGDLRQSPTSPRRSPRPRTRSTVSPASSDAPAAMTTTIQPTTSGTPASPPRRRRTLTTLLGRQPLGIALAAPYAVFLALLFAYPVGLAVWISFHDYFFAAPGVSVERPFVGFDNYTTALSDPAVRRSFLNVLVFLVINVPLTVVLSLLLATALNAAIRGRTFFRVAYFVPYVSASVAIVAVWLFLFSNGGFVNELLGPLGARPVMARQQDAGHAADRAVRHVEAAGLLHPALPRCAAGRHQAALRGGLDGRGRQVRFVHRTSRSPASGRRRRSSSSSRSSPAPTCSPSPIC